MKLDLNAWIQAAPFRRNATAWNKNSSLTRLKKSTDVIRKLARNEIGRVAIPVRHVKVSWERKQNSAEFSAGGNVE